MPRSSFKDNALKKLNGDVLPRQEIYNGYDEWINIPEGEEQTIMFEKLPNINIV